MEIYALIAILLLVVYGLMTVYAAYQQFRAGKIDPWAAVGMFGATLALLGAGFLLGELSPFTFPVLIVALVGLHALAVVNGLHMNGKINWRHQITRGILTLLLIALTFLALN
jgi:hypothetical protein